MLLRSGQGRIQSCPNFLEVIYVCRPIPPDWSGGYTSIFAAQQDEAWDADQLAAIARQAPAARAKRPVSMM